MATSPTILLYSSRRFLVSVEFVGRLILRDILMTLADTGLGLGLGAILIFDAVFDYVW